MKKLLFFLFFAFPTVSFADTLEVWSVHINDSLVANFDPLSELTIQLNNLKEKDRISIQYSADRPCPRCVYLFAVKNLEGEKLFVRQRSNSDISEPVKFPARSILKPNGFFEDANPNWFEFFLYKQEKGRAEGEYQTLLIVPLQE